MTVSTTVQAEYRKQRAKGARPLNALEVARNMQHPTWPLLQVADDAASTFHVTWEGWGVQVTVEQERYPDVTWAGKFTSTWRVGAVQNSDWRPGNHEHLHRWFIPAYDYGNREHLAKEGLARHDRWLAVQRYIRQDEHIAKGGDEHPQWIIRAKAQRAGVTLGDDLVGGFDMGPDWSPYYMSDDDLHELNMTAAAVVYDAVSQAQDTLKRLTSGCLCIGEPRQTGIPPNPDCPLHGEDASDG